MNFDLISFLLGGVVFVAFGWWIGTASTKRQLRQLEDKHKQSEDERQKVVRQLEQQTKHAEQASAQLTALEQEHSSLKTRLPKLEGFERANSDLRLQLQGFDTVKRKLEAAEQELVGLRQKAGEFDALAQKLETIQQEFSQHKTRTAGFEALAAKAARVDELEYSLAASEAQKTKQLGELSTMAVKVSDAEHAQQKLRGSLDESLNEISRLRAGIKAFEGLQARVEELDQRGISPETQAKLQGLEIELGVYRERVTQLEARLARIPELEAQVLRLQATQSEVPSLPEVEVATEAADVPVSSDVPDALVSSDVPDVSEEQSQALAENT